MTGKTAATEIGEMSAEDIVAANQALGREADAIRARRAALMEELRRRERAGARPAAAPVEE